MNLKNRLFEHVMNNPNNTDGYSNYIGHDWSGWYCGLIKTRDSDVLEESNFATAVEMLGGEVTGQVEIRSCNHWACGYFDQIMIKSDAQQVKVLSEILEKLEDYPVLDDDDFYERQNEYHSEYATQVKNKLANALSVHFKVKNGPKLVEIAYNLTVFCQEYYGDDSCIDIYDFRVPTQRDIDRLKICIREMENNYNLKSLIFKQLKKNVENYKITEKKAG